MLVPIEKSHGKARPTLPRSSDLPALDPACERRRTRDDKGRFTPGNSEATGRGWKQALAKVIGKDAGDTVATIVARDAWRLFLACMREMPSDGPTVRGLIAQKARHEALAGYWSARAVEHGLDSEAGVLAQDQATKHGQRAERLAVTALDVAVRLAKSKPSADPHKTFFDTFASQGEPRGEGHPTGQPDGKPTEQTPADGSGEAL